MRRRIIVALVLPICVRTRTAHDRAQRLACIRKFKRAHATDSRTRTQMTARPALPLIVYVRFRDPSNGRLARGRLLYTLRRGHIVHDGVLRRLVSTVHHVRPKVIKKRSASTTIVVLPAAATSTGDACSASVTRDDATPSATIKEEEVITTVQPVVTCTLAETRAIIPVSFEGVAQYGDFGYMIEHEHWGRHSLFIYNDNVEQFLLKGDRSPGGGNACIRPHRFDRAMPIPTGSFNSTKPGFTSLDQLIPDAHADGALSVKKIVDDAVRDIRKLLNRRPDIRRIFYSSDAEGLLGCGIFDVSPPVLQYITKQLYTLE